MTKEKNELIDRVSSYLDVLGYGLLSLELPIIPGRNNETFIEKDNGLFIKIYKDKNTFENALSAYKLTSNIVTTPNLLIWTGMPDNPDEIISTWKLATGKVYSHAFELNSDQIRKVSNSLRQIHQIDVSKLPIGPLFNSPGPSQTWASYLTDWVFKSLESTDREISGINKTETLKLARSYIKLGINDFSDKDKSLLHGDINISNFIFNDENSQITISDMDYAIVGDPAWEFASAVADWKYSDSGYTRILNSYIKGLNKGNIDIESFKKRVKFYGPLKKLVLIYLIGNTADLDSQKEVKKCIEEMGAKG